MSKKDVEESGTKDISEMLDDLDDDWSETEEDKGFAEIPRSNQVVKITSATIGKVKSNPSRIQITFEVEIATGDFKGRKLWLRLGLTDPEQRSRTRGALARLGVEWPKKVGKIAGLVADLEDTYAEVKVVPKDDGSMPNAYFNKALDDVPEEEEDDELPKKKKKKDDDEEPVKKKKKKEEPEEDEDDEDEKPAKKKKKEEPEDDDDDDEDEKKEEDDDDDDDEEPKKKKSDDEPKVEVKFTDKDLDEVQIKKIKKLAKSQDFELEHYDNMTDLLIDIGEHCGLSGTYKGFKALYTAIDEKVSDE